MALDLRTEEETARRLNAGRTTITAGSVGKSTDLFGPGALRSALAGTSREQGVAFDEEALTYLALAAEARLRSLLQSTITAQIHRTTSSHARPAPMANGKPMWSHEAINDPQAVIEAINRANKDAEQTFRASRMDRLARETELQRARDARERAMKADEAPGPGPSDAAGPSTPAKGSSPGASATATPVFGAVSEKKGGSSKKSSAKSKDVSAEVAHKLSNATALMNAGVFGRKNYSWLTNASQPAVSSPLAGKKRKAEKEAGVEEAKTETVEGGPSAAGPADEAVFGAKGTPGAKTERTHKRRRPKLTEPSRRQVVVSRDASGERKIPDDRAVTLTDVLFVLEKDGVGRGMGSGDDLVRKIWATGGVGQ